MVSDKFKFKLSLVLYTVYMHHAYIHLCVLGHACTQSNSISAVLLELDFYNLTVLCHDIKDKLKAHMSKHHRLGDANTNSGYYNYWKRLLTFANLTTSDSFWNNTRINVSQKTNVMKFRTGTL